MYLYFGGCILCGVNKLIHGSGTLPKDSIKISYYYIYYWNCYCCKVSKGSVLEV